MSATTVNLLGKIRQDSFCGSLAKSEIHLTKMPTRCRNQGTLASSGVPINVDETVIVPDAQDLMQLVQEKMVADLAPSDVDLRPVNFESIFYLTPLSCMSHLLVLI